MKLESLLKKYRKLVDRIVDGDTAAEAKVAGVETEIEKLTESAKAGYGEAFVEPYEKEYRSLRSIIYHLA